MKKKIKKFYSFKLFISACNKIKGIREYTKKNELIYYGPDSEKISKEIDNEL